MGLTKKMNDRCIATTKRGTRCSKNKTGDDFCKIHARKEGRRCQMLNSLDAFTSRCGAICGQQEWFCEHHYTDDICSICLNDLSPEMTINLDRCNHVFCIDCLDRWLLEDDRCPYCRVTVHKTELELSIRRVQWDMWNFAHNHV